MLNVVPLLLVWRGIQITRELLVLPLKVNFASISSSILQASVWITDSEHFLKTTRDGAKQCKTEEEVVDLLDMLEGFVKPGLNKQEARLKKLAELSAKLTMDEPRYKAKDLMAKQKEIATKFDLMDNDLFRLAERLRERKERGLPPKVKLLGTSWWRLCTDTTQCLTTFLYQLLFCWPFNVKKRKKKQSFSTPKVHLLCARAYSKLCSSCIGQLGNMHTN